MSGTNKITLILFNAVLEWVLIILLLLNSVFSYLILRFANHFALKRPCLLCSRLDHGNKNNSYKELICDFHGHEISGLTYCSNHRKLAESQRICENCSSNSSPINSHVVLKKSELMNHDETKTPINLTCSCCDASMVMKKKGNNTKLILHVRGEVMLDNYEKGQLHIGMIESLELIHNGEPLILLDKGSDLRMEMLKKVLAPPNFSNNYDCVDVVQAIGATTTGVQKLEEDDSECKMTSFNQTSNDYIFISPYNETGENIMGEESLDGSDSESEEDLTSESLKSALADKRKALSALYVELEEERNASAISANQTMAMINRLQEEKAAMQMEALQYQRMMEEQSEYDQEALQLLNGLLMKKEREKENLEKELQIYKRKVENDEANEYSNGEDSDKLSFDFDRGNTPMRQFGVFEKVSSLGEEKEVSRTMG